MKDWRKRAGAPLSSGHEKDVLIGDWYRNTVEKRLTRPDDLGLEITFLEGQFFIREILSILGTKIQLPIKLKIDRRTSSITEKQVRVTKLHFLLNALRFEAGQSQKANSSYLRKLRSYTGLLEKAGYKEAINEIYGLGLYTDPAEFNYLVDGKQILYLDTVDFYDFSAMNGSYSKKKITDRAKKRLAMKKITRDEFNKLLAYLKGLDRLSQKAKTCHAKELER